MEIFDFGLINYKQAQGFQKQIFESVRAGQSPNTLIICRQLAVVTLGRSADKKNILAAPEQLKSKGIEVFEVERGGDVTYHGPGQLTAYPVFNLKYFKKDLHSFLRNLEQVAIDLSADWGIKAERIAGSTGAWVSKRKIASIGIAVRNWVTYHGLSINVKADDLANFRLIRACGLDAEMTSMETELGSIIEFNAVKENLVAKFREVFQIGAERINYAEEVVG